MIHNPNPPMNPPGASIMRTEASALSYLQFASILHQGLEKMAEIQKSTLEIYSQQSQGAIESIKNAFPVAPVHLFELAELAIRQLFQVQVHLLDLMVKQSAACAEASKIQSNSGHEGVFVKAMGNTTDSFLAMHKKAVEFVTQQSQSFRDDIMGQINGDGSLNSADAIQRGTEAIIQAQKRFWDAMLKPFQIWQTEPAQPLNKN
jgi:hypothetical protein